MLFKTDPNNDETIAIPFRDNSEKYYLLFSRLTDIVLGDEEYIIDDRLIALSNKSQREVVGHRNNLIECGYYKPTELYMRELVNPMYKPKARLRPPLF